MDPGADSLPSRGGCELSQRDLERSKPPALFVLHCAKRAALANFGDTGCMSLLGSSTIMAFSATTDAARALAFYRDQLGLRFVSDEGFALVFDAAGTMLRVQRVKEIREAQYTTLGWRVPDIAAMVEELEKAGVRFEHYGLSDQDEKGIWTVPGGAAKVAWFKDPDGNILSLTQF